MSARQTNGEDGSFALFALYPDLPTHHLDELLAFENTTVPDLIGDGCRLLFVGINPGLWTAATQTHFAHPGNRFYPALEMAGITADTP